MTARTCFGQRVVASLVALALVTAAANAAAQEGDTAPKFRWLSAPRKISRAWSASRDTPVMELAIYPRASPTAGGELAMVALEWPSWTLRAGFAGMLQLEWDGGTESVNSGPFPSGDGTILWRGSYAYFVAVALDSFAEQLCEGCALELTLQYRHESQHYTGSNEGDEGIDVSAEPYVGDDFIFDVAFSQRVGDWYFAERAIGMWFLPDRSSYAAGVGADLHARWLLWPLAHPFASAYAERLFGDDLRDRRFPDVYRVRGLLGFALPSDLGDVMIFASGGVGHRYGIRGLTEEATLGLGVRLAIGTTEPL